MLESQLGSNGVVGKDLDTDAKERLSDEQTEQLQQLQSAVQSAAEQKPGLG